MWLDFIIEYGFLLGVLGISILSILIRELLFQIKKRNIKKN